jgi:hypothetical protein
VTTFKHWLDERIDLEEVRIAIGHDMREFALLWLVFSGLDPLVAGSSSFRWMIANGAFCVVLWVAGSYIEMRRSMRGKE